ncbi:uncharacterized protein LOC111388260 [Olea europaea var. sylvestris]|uniref:uncharacterized protein LOC111388260 n=1 Tax=Olea europaea var. sylvestris TaxID=158386 RepID=UPI000C1D3FDE|nr:uncharacterized protein LOC111388260 [Olea europaea var. sylvestris]
MEKDIDKAHELYEKHQAENLLEILKKLRINIPFICKILQIPNYFKFLKEMLTKKRKLPKHETVTLSEGCNAILQHKLPPKIKDLGNFILPCSIGDLRNSRASSKLMPLNIYRKLGLLEPKEISIMLQLIDRSIKDPWREIEDMIIKAGNFIFPSDFVDLDIGEN